MIRHDVGRTILGTLCVVVVCSCGQAADDQPAGSDNIADTEWTRVAALDARVGGLLAQGQNQLMRAENGFVSHVERGRRRPMLVHLSELASGLRDLRIGGAQRLSVRIESRGARDVPGEVDRGHVVYRDAFPATDVVGVATPALYEELWVLKDPEAPDTFRWQLTPGPGLSGPVRGPGGAATFSDALGRGVIRIGEPYAVDASGTRHDVAVQWSEDGREVTYHLEHRGLPHPVVIDPPLTALPRWKLMTPAQSPPARSAGGMIYYPTASAAMLFGGIACPSPCAALGDAWTYTSAGWSDVTATLTGGGPGAIAYATFFGDPTNNALRVYGGWTGSTVKSELWSLTGTNWQLLAANGGAGVLESATAAWRGDQLKFLLVGGESDYGLVPYTYTQSQGAAPFAPIYGAPTDVPPRRDHAMVFDTANGPRLLLFGGRGCLRGQTCAPMSDVWERKSGGWQAVSSPQPPPGRWGHGMAFDSDRGHTVVFGGRTETGVLGDTWELTVGGQWERTVPEGKGPPARAHAAMAFDSSRGVTVLFGGLASAVEPENAAEHLADTWEYAPVDVTCTTGADCDTGYCVDGVCCDKPACAKCESCAWGDSVGTCAPVVGKDPDSCNGTCEGGACVKDYGSPCTQGSECSGGVCSGGQCCPSLCDGACESCVTGICAPLADGTHADACKELLCNGVSGDCPEFCDTNEDCLGEKLECSPSTRRCRPARGQPCAAPDDCASGFCADGVCCNEVCDGPCEACSEATGYTGDGVCGVAFPGNPQGSTCPEGYSCDGSGTECVEGQFCAKAGDCASGVCIEGRCCKSLYDCGTKCDAKGTAVIDVATGKTTPCEYGCYFGFCATLPMDCRARGCASGEQCSSTGQCVANPPEGEHFERETPVGCVCRSTRPGYRTGSGSAGALLLLALGLARRRRRARRAPWMAIGASMVLLGASGCAAYDAEQGEPCRQAGYSIASRIHACTGDETAANDAYKRFADTYVCTAPPDREESYECAAQLRDFGCDVVADYGSDLDRWVTATPECLALLTNNALEQSSNCFDLAQAVAPKVATCALPKDPYLTVFASVLAALSQRGCVASASQVALCKSELEDLPCSAVTAAADADAWALSTPGCAALLEAP